MKRGRKDRRKSKRGKQEKCPPGRILFFLPTFMGMGGKKFERGKERDAAEEL